MTRLLSLLVVLAACDAPASALHHPDDPDASTCDFSIGGYQIAAPQPGLHYDKSLDVVLDESELQGEFDVQITDDHGQSFAPLTRTYAAYPGGGSGSWWSEDTYRFGLAANTRYALTVQVHGCAERSTSVEFFTSAE